jgi:hypothetical protein
MAIAGKLGFSQEEFTSKFLAKVFGILGKRLSEARDVRESLIISELEPAEASRLTTIMQKPEVLPDSDKTTREYIERVRAEKYKTSAPSPEMLLEIRKYKQGSGSL